MKDLNSVVLMGRLVRDCEIKYTSAGTALAKFSIAVNRSVKDGDGQWKVEPSFFDCTMFGARAEAVSQYLTKGKQVGVSGELRQNRWEQDDGQKRSKIEVVVNDIQLVGKREEA